MIQLWSDTANTGDAQWWVTVSSGLFAALIALSKAVAYVRSRWFAVEKTRIEADQAKDIARAPAELQYIESNRLINDLLFKQLKDHNDQVNLWKIEANTWRTEAERRGISYAKCEEQCRELQNEVIELREEIARLEKHIQQLETEIREMRSRRGR